MQEHPVGEALFNLVNAWTLMFWPLMLADHKGEHVKNKFPWYIASQFLVRHCCITRACVALAVPTRTQGRVKLSAGLPQRQAAGQHVASRQAIHCTMQCAPP